MEGAPHLGQEIQALSTDPLAFDQSIKALRSYSLIQRNPTERLLSVHRLVQAVLKDAMNEAIYRLWAERTVQAVQEVLPHMDHSTRERYERCLSHAQGCTQLIEQLHLTSSVAARLLHQTVRYLREQARYKEAEPLLQRVLQIREQALGPEHPNVASALYSLAKLYHGQDKYSQAEPLYQRALHIREQIFGLDHPDVAPSLHGLASLYRKQGRYAEAEQLFQRALQIWEQAWGPEHPDVAYPLHGLANLYFDQGKYTQAKPLYQRALHIRELALGPHHPLTQKTKRSYASLQRTKERETGKANCVLSRWASTLGRTVGAILKRVVL